jgi:SAM-dependent methyltransferase
MRTGFYDEYGEKWLSSGRDGLEELASAYQVATLCELLGDLAPKRVIDYGCALGDALHLVARRLGVSEAVGIDISRSMIEAARERHPECTFICGGTEALEVASADLVVFFDVIEHVADIPSLLRAARSCAQRIAIKVPLERTAYTRVLRALRLKGEGSRHLETEGHLYEFAKGDVVRLVEASGFDVVASRVTSPPSTVFFHPHVRAELGAAGGIRGAARRAGHSLLERLPYGFARRVLTLIEGSDLFLVCERARSR